MSVYRQFHEWVLGSWWIWLFVLFCFFCYEQAVKNLKEDFGKLEGQLESLQRELHDQLALQEDLRIQINSQSDPSWIELVLMKGLGLVPEGQIKVFFRGSP